MLAALKVELLPFKAAIPVISILITGKYFDDLLKRRTYVVAESESFIVITGIGP